MFGVERQEIQPSKPYVFISPAIERRSAVNVRAVKLKKQGGAAR
jgi:hypothetical protein